MHPKVARALRAARRPYADGGNVVRERATILPLGTYGDGTTRAAWPGVIYEPAAAAKRLVDYFMGGNYRPGDDDATRQLAEDSFTAASAVPVAGLAAAAVRPGTSLGSGGGRIKGYHGTERAERIGQDKPERMWMTGDRTSQSADAANSYAYGMGHRDVPAVYKVEGRFQNPLEVEGGGNHFQFIEFDGRKYGADSLADEAARRGHDALVVKNVKDHASSYENTPNITSVAALQPGTVYDDYGNLLFSNSSKASTPGLAALESNRVRGGMASNPHDQAKAAAEALSRALGRNVEVLPGGSAAGQSAYIRTPIGELRFSDHAAGSRPGQARDYYGSDATPDDVVSYVQQKMDETVSRLLAGPPPNRYGSPRPNWMSADEWRAFYEANRTDKK